MATIFCWKIDEELLTSASFFCLSTLNLIQKKKKVFVKPVKKQPSNVDHITGDKIPKSFVFSRGKLPGPLKQLQMDLRKLMSPFTALNLKVKLFFYLLFFSEAATG